jgi:hypothetical protein
MDKHTINTVFKEYIHPIDEKVIQKMVDFMQLDHYTKKLYSLPFLKLSIYSQLTRLDSLRRISFKVKHKKRLQRILGLKSISKSQLSRKLSELPPALFQAIFHHLVQQIHQEFGEVKGNQVLEKVHLIDSSTISMCLTQHEWADFRETKAGVKIHTRVVFHEEDTCPDKVIATPARPADATQLDALMVEEEGALNVFDRGYYNFEKFDEYCENNVLFCTRIKDNTIIEAIEECDVDPSTPVRREAIVKLRKMKHPVRLIETEDSQGNLIRIIMNDAKRSAQEISDLYRNRWQIELFFKWMKQHLVLKKCYGKSENAVYNQIYIAMITFCLNLLMKKRVSYKGTLLELFDFLEEYWWRSFNVFVKELFRPPDRTSRGKQKRNDERIFLETMIQYEEGEIDHIDDLTYDPIII